MKKNETIIWNNQNNQSINKNYFNNKFFKFKLILII